LKITEDILRMKLKRNVSSWHIDSFRRVDKKTGGRPALVRRISLTKKIEVPPATRNLAKTKIRTEKDYSAKVREIRRRLIPYLKGARQQGNTAHFRKDKLVMNRRIYDLEFIHSLVFSLEGRAWQEPEPSHVTGMALAHCIMGKFLGVGCHCFPPPLNVPTLAARCLRPQRRERS